MGGYDLGYEGARHSMGKRFAPINCCRPGLDLLESRHLLSGVNDALHASVAPAMIISLNYEASTDDQAFSRPAIMPSISYGLPSGPSRTFEPAQAIPFWGGFWPAHTGFET